MGQYDWLFFKFPKEETHANGMLPPVQAYFRGENSVSGSQVTLPYRAYLKPGVIDDERVETYKVEPLPLPASIEVHFAG